MNIRDLFTGFRMFTSSMGYLSRNGMGKMYLWMIIVALLFSILYFYLMSQAYDVLMDMLLGVVSSWDLPEWVTTAFGWIVSIALYVAGFMLFHMINGTVVLVLLSPLFSYIAKRAYHIEMGEKPKELPLLKSIGRGVLFALRNFMVQLSVWMVLYLIGFMVPIVQPAVPFLIVAVNAFYYALSMADYTMELRGMNVGQSSHYGSQNRLTLCGIGLPFAAILMVPFVGSYIAIFFAPVVEIATLKLCLHGEGNE
ncbi:MAG: EI24 domain-containing protein [Bacteroidia bacterium]|nr:EI24 domain-containing protein [Bacteroidia bacterium]